MDNREIRQHAVMITLIAINVLIFLYMYITGDPSDGGYMAAHGANYPELINREGEYYRFFTCMFLHFDMRHLMNNMLLLAAAGNYLEDALGHVKFLILYLIAGLGGSLLSYGSMMVRGDYAVSAGASGAIFGLLGALLWVVIRHKGRYKRLSGKGMLFMVALAFYAGVSGDNVDNMAHLGGLVMGFLMGILLYRHPHKD